MLALFEGLSERSRYLRFHGLPEVGERLAASSSTRTGASAARSSGRWGRPPATGSLRSGTRPACATRAAPRSASRSRTSFQGRGVGTRLLEQLAERAARGRHRALRRARPRGQPSHAGVFLGAGFEWRASRQRARSRCRSRSRRPRSSASASTSATMRRSSRRFEPFFAPASVAVLRRLAVGRARSAASCFRNIAEGGFEGRPTPSTAAASLWRASRGSPRSTTCPRRLTSP